MSVPANVVVVVTMASYLREIDFAASSLIDLLWKERAELDARRVILARLEDQAREGYNRAAFLADNFDDPDDVMLATGGYWDTYFGPDKEAHGARARVAEAQAVVRTHEFSVAAIAGAVLQFAKQGMSMVNGGLGKSPPGRNVGSQPLKSVVWEGRNQAQHWDEDLSRRVRDCFDTLATEFDPRFRDYLTRSLAMDVVELLGWRAFPDFEEDLASLG